MKKHLKLRDYKEKDRNFILNSYLKNNANKLNLPSWGYKKLHDAVDAMIDETQVVVFNEDEDLILAYKLAEYTYIKLNFRVYTKEILELLKGEE